MGSGAVPPKTAGAKDTATATRSDAKSSPHAPSSSLQLHARWRENVRDAELHNRQHPELVALFLTLTGKQATDLYTVDVRALVRSWQSRHGMVVDGMISPAVVDSARRSQATAEAEHKGAAAEKIPLGSQPLEPLEPFVPGSLPSREELWAESVESSEPIKSHESEEGAAKRETGSALTQVLERADVKALSPGYIRYIAHTPQALPEGPPAKLPIFRSDAIPTPLVTQVGTLDYYRLRNLDYLRRHTTPPPPDYYLRYGDKYVHRFQLQTRPLLSRMGQAWVDQTLRLLQKAIEDKLEENAKEFDWLEQNQADFKEFAYHSHSKAYLKAGLHRLPVSDLILIAQTPDREDLNTDEGLRQVVETVKELLPQWNQDFVQFNMNPPRR